MLGDCGTRQGNSKGIGSSSTLVDSGLVLLFAFFFLLAWGGLEPARAQSIDFRSASECVSKTAAMARLQNIEVATVMIRMLDRDKFAWRVAHARNGDRNFASARRKVDRVFSKPLAGPAFGDIDLTSIRFFPRRSRAVNLRLSADPRPVTVFELIGDYGAKRARVLRLIDGEERRVPRRYGFVMWIWQDDIGCRLVDLTWSNLSWSRHVNRLE